LTRLKVWKNLDNFWKYKETPKSNSWMVKSSWHEFFLGVSLYLCKFSAFSHIFNQKCSPFFHIFNQKSLNLCNFLGVATFYQERLIDFLNVENNWEPRDVYTDVKFYDNKWFVGESEKMILNYAETESESEWCGSMIEMKILSLTNTEMIHTRMLKIL